MRLALIVLFFLGCSGTWQESYSGPVQDPPIVSIYSQYTIGATRYGFSKSIRFLAVSNARLEETVVEVNCSYGIFPDVHIPARTTIKFMLPDEATSCTVTTE